MKKKSILFIIIFVIFFGTFTIISIVKPQKSFSENENRLLQQRPPLIWSDVISGEFGISYENYLADQFIGRDLWIRLKTLIEQSRGMKEINGVYFGKDNYLIEKKEEVLYNGEQAQKNIAYLKEFTNVLNTNESIISHNVMFVPTAETVLKDKLPSNVYIFDQYQWIENLNINSIDLKNSFNNESNALYYRTDHHWTTYGAYVAYKQWLQTIGIQPISIDCFKIQTITNNFYGTLHSKVNTQIPPDLIEVYERVDVKSQFQVSADGQEIYLYDENKLNTKDQYGYFLGGNYGQVIIENKNPIESNRNLLIIKDSYANCFVPFASEHFQKTIMVDLRHTNQSILETIENEEITDVLVLYSTDNFVTDRNIFKLKR